MAVSNTHVPRHGDACRLPGYDGIWGHGNRASRGTTHGLSNGKAAPHVPPESLSVYGFKRAADDIKELVRQIGVSQIILGGHDW